MSVPVAETFSEFYRGHYVSFLTGVSGAYVYYVWRARGLVRYSREGWESDAWPIPGDSRAGISVHAVLDREYQLTFLAA